MSLFVIMLRFGGMLLISGTGCNKVEKYDDHILKYDRDTGTVGCTMYKYNTIKEKGLQKIFLKSSEVEREKEKGNS